MNQYGFCDYPTYDSNGVCQGCGYSPCRSTQFDKMLIKRRFENKWGEYIDGLENLHNSIIDPKDGAELNKIIRHLRAITLRASENLIEKEKV